MKNNNTALIIFIFQRQQRYIRPGKSTVKGIEKKHKMQHVASKNIEPDTELNLRYSAVYFFKGRVYCGRSQWKRTTAELIKAKLRNLIIFQISCS